MNNQEPLFITGIEIRDFKRITAVKMQLDAEAGLVTIGGENAQGKTSILDAIESALVGIPKSIKRPVHDGAEGAAIRLTIPPYEVRRWWGPDGKPGLKVVRMDDGSSTPPSEFLKRVIGGFIDPIEFMEMDPRDQRAKLIELTGLDLTECDREIETAKMQVDSLDQYQVKLKHQVEDLPEDPDAPQEETPVTELTAKLEEAMKVNSENDSVRQQVAALEFNAQSRSHEVDRTKQRIEAARKALAAEEAELKVQEDALAATEASVKVARDEAAKLADVDLAPIQSAIANVDATNAAVRANKAKAQARVDWMEAEKKLKDAVANHKALQDKKKKLLSDAKFPVDGLGFDSKNVTYNGQAFSDSSHAEQVRISLAIALAQRGQLAPILIRDASTLDKKTLALIHAEAVKAGAQVFAEVITNKDGDGYDAECSFTIEDGTVWEAKQ